MRCAAEIPKGSVVCPYCDAEIVADPKKNKETIDSSEEPKSEEISLEDDETDVDNEADELVGKRYELRSSRGMRMFSLFNTSVRSVVHIGEDRLHISIKPDKMNVSPVIMLEDILAIELKRKMAPYYVILIIFGIIACFSNPLFILLVLFLWWSGTNTKITISQRNGIRVVMYAMLKSEAVAFKEDMKKITNIQ